MMSQEEKIKIKQDRLNSLRNSPKNVKSPGVIRKLTRQIRNLERDTK